MSWRQQVSDPRPHCSLLAEPGKGGSPLGHNAAMTVSCCRTLSGRILDVLLATCATWFDLRVGMGMKPSRVPLSVSVAR